MPTPPWVQAARGVGTSPLTLRLSQAPGSQRRPCSGPLGAWSSQSWMSTAEPCQGLLRHGGTFPWVLPGPRVGVK